MKKLYEITSKGDRILNNLVAIGLCTVIFLTNLPTISAKFRITDPEVCGRTICPENSKFAYVPGIKYTYKYSISIKSMFDGAGNQSSDLHIDSVFHIQFRSKCEGILQITGAEIANEESLGEDRTHLNEFGIGLSKNPLRFYFENGKITEICTEPDEKVWVINFKKGILSAMKNTMERFDVDQYTWERDISGDCLSGYFFKEVNGTTLVINRQRDLTTCTSRYQFYSIIPTTHYIFQKKYHRWTPLNSTLVCNQHIDHRVYTKVVCLEEHAYQPFYNQTNGAKTTSRQEFVLISEKPMSTSEKEKLENIGLVKYRDTLLFDHRRPQKATHDDVFECEQLLKSLCTLTADSFHPDFPDRFNRFIHIARYLSTEALNKLYQESSAICPSGKKHLLNALPYIRSRASTFIMTKEILKKEIPQETINEWLLVMSFFPRPDAETISSVAKLVVEDTVEAQTLLSVSTMVYAFCENNQNCQKYSSVSQISSKIESLFNTTCVNLQHQDRALSALKALGNIGVTTDTLSESLQTCILNEMLPVMLRVSAIQAHRRLPCDFNHDFLLNVFNNNTNDQEVRIAAYLQLIKCPTYTTLRTIKNALDTEEFNQVGSFVWSHLKNQMRSAMPSRIEIQGILQDEQLNNKFDKDFRKFSRNFESSFFLNKLGSGGFVETNIIFSEKSYIPRSITTNVTMKLFGESMNLFEISLYLVDFEKYAEKWFPLGWLKGQILEAFNNTRYQRDVPDLKYLVDGLPLKFLKKLNFKASLSLKMFGNEVKYYSINNNTDFDKIVQNMNPLKLVNKFFGGQEINYESSTMLMDTSYTAPMTAGLPLKINVVGTASINVNAMGFVNTTQFQTNGGLQIDGKLKPSIGIDFEGSMVVDTFILENGVKFKGTVFTSTAIEGSLDMKSYKFVSVSFNLPMKKSDLFHAETKLILKKGTMEESIDGITAGRTENRMCTWSIMDELIGLKFCTNSLLPNTTLLMKSPLFLFSGPLKFGISLEKSDPTANKYVIEYRMEDAPNKTIITFKCETPGSNTKRGMKAVIDLDTQSQNITLVYHSTLSQVTAHGVYRNTATEKSINFGLDINGKKHIDVQAGLDIATVRNGFTYSPKLELIINNKKIVYLSGSFKWVRKNEVSQCDVDLDFHTNRVTMILSGYVRKNAVSVATNVKMNYRFGSAKMETVRMEVMLGDRSSKFLTQLYGNLQLESTAYPQINMIVTLKYQKAQGHIECKVAMQTNPFVSDESKKLYVEWAFQYFKTFSGSKMNTSIEVFKPASDIDFKIGLTHIDNSGTNYITTLSAKFAKGKEVLIRLDLNLPHSTMFTFESRLTISLIRAQEQAWISTKIYEKSFREYDIEFQGQWFSKHNLTVKGMYVDRSDSTILSHSLKLLSRSEIFKDILFTGKLMVREDEYKADFQVDHNNIKYELAFRHSSKGIGLFETFAEAKYNKSSYSITNFVDLVQRQTTLELHLDKYRDIHIALRGLTNKTMLDAGLDVKWDANRDPSRKIVVILVTNSHGSFDYDGNCIMEYSGRVVTSNFLIQRKGKNYVANGKVEWSPTDVVDVYMHGMYDIPDNGLARVSGRVSTPFPKWEYTGIEYIIKLEDKGIQSNGSLNWIYDQKADFELSYNYLFTNKIASINFIGSLNSTIPGVNTMYAILEHTQKFLEYNTLFALQTSPSSTVKLNSTGLISYSTDEDKYILTLSLATPFTILQKAAINSGIFIYSDLRIKANLNLNGNGKKYSIIGEGSFNEDLSENRINIHMNTPIDKYKLITAKLGYSALNKHIIADLRSQGLSAGVDLIYLYNNVSNFDLKLKAHASVTYVTNLIVVAKFNSDTVDLRCGWNKVMIGLIGSTHYSSWHDVDYSVQLFTPIEGFHTCSAIAKFIYDDRFDFEISVEVKDKKIGLMVQGMKKPDDDFAVIEIPVKTPIVKVTTNGTANSTEVEVEVIELLDPFGFEEPDYGEVFWRSVLKLDSLFYPTVKMQMQINEEDKEYHVSSVVVFPFGKIKLTDTLEYLDLFHISNNINITTTCDCLQELNSEFSLDAAINRYLKTHFNVAKHAYNKTDEGQMSLDYNFAPLDEHSESEGLYTLRFQMETPFNILRHCKANVNLLAEKNVYESNTTLEINNSSVSLDGNLEIDDSYLETNVGIKINSTTFVLPMSRMSIHKDFSDFEKKLDLGLALPNAQGDGLVDYGVELKWHDGGANYLKYFAQLKTPYQSVGMIRGNFELIKDPDSEDFTLEAYTSYSNTTEVKIRSQLRRNLLSLQMDTTFEAFRQIYVNSTIKNNGGIKTLEVTLSLDKDHQMKGWATIAPTKSLMVELKLYKTQNKARVLNALITVSRKETGYELNSLIQYHGDEININGDLIVIKGLGKTLDLSVTSTYPGYQSLELAVIFLTNNPKSMVTRISGNTVSKFLTTKAIIDLKLSLEEKGGLLETKFDSPLFDGNMEIIWYLDFLQQMSVDVKGGFTYSETTKEISARAYVWNVNKEFREMSLGTEIDFNNKVWWLNANTTLLFPEWNDIKFLTFVLLPHDKEKMHTVSCKIHFTKDFSYASHLIKYATNPTDFLFKTLSEINIGKETSNGIILLETGKHRFCDKFTVITVNNGYDLNNLLQSTNMDHDLTLNMLYSKPLSSHDVKLKMNYPPNEPVVVAWIEFNTVNNMLARMNFSTPFKILEDVKLKLDVVTNKYLYLRYGEVQWTNKSAVFNYSQKSKDEKGSQDTNGDIIVEFPLTTRHVGHLSYNYKSSDAKAIGYSSMEYNGDHIASGNYSRETNYTQTTKNDLININVNNSFMPAGIIYLYKIKMLQLLKDIDYSLPYEESRRLEIFKLYNKTDFNITGELETIKEDMAIAKSMKIFLAQRKIEIDTYNGQDLFSTNGNFTLKRNLWAGFGIDIRPKNELPGHQIHLNISYPRRHFMAISEYELSTDKINMKFTIHPNEKMKAKYFGGEIHWQQIPSNPEHHFAKIAVWHPALNKNLTLNLELSSNCTALLDLHAELEYSQDTNRKLTIDTVIFSKVKSYIYPEGQNIKKGAFEINALGIHPASRLEFTAIGVMEVINEIIGLRKNITYKRSYLPLQFWSTDAKIDTLNNIVELEKKSLRDFSYIRGRYGQFGSIHNAKCAIVSGNDVYLSGDFDLDIQHRKTSMVVNFTPDATERLNVKGLYKDHRKAEFNVWRTYGIYKISDIAYILQLNHSRILSSSLSWRPQIPTELLVVFQNTSNFLWNYAFETTNFWTDYIKSETTDTFMDIWLDAKPLLQDFIDDIRNVRDLDRDIQHFKRVFREAYNLNEFYMKDIYNMYLVLAEEISFKDKMGNVPKIVNELWEIMGETGETIRQSILWVVDTVKKIYDRTVEFLKGLMSGEAVDKLSRYVLQLAEKYDKLIKEVHISFLHYMEYLWHEASTFVSYYWHRGLMSIEPSFIQFVHYIESVFWDNSLKALEFMYQRQSEFLNSTVFSKSSKLTLDLDKFYQDLTKNDFMTNLRKYTSMLVELVQEKYFTFVPFGAELNEIGSEILGEIKELRTLPAINFTIQATKEVYAQALWLYYYLNLGEKFQRIVPVVLDTVEDLSHSALENEIINHEGRTKFIFDPESGLIKLEQKLPMPWHAFNETPNFEEIPEYKLFSTVQKWMVPSNKTLLTYYYQYSPLLDPTNWLPPFKAQALVVRGKQFITFDKKQYEVQASCSYLLAKDFVDNTFALVLNNSHSIAVVLSKNVIVVDLLNDVIKMDNAKMRFLPLEIEGVEIYREEGVAVVNMRNRFHLHCNLKYDVCTFELSGWYYGKTAGLFGTMDNEPSNDFLSSSGDVKTDVKAFVNSWILGSCHSENAKKMNIHKNEENCTALFQSKSSMFSSCFSTVDPTLFKNTCLRNIPGVTSEMCTSSFAYVKACENENTPIRIPDFCSSCMLLGRKLEEGHYEDFKMEKPSKSTDVVFIIESHKCNKYILERRFRTFLNTLAKELNNVQITNQRYAVVTYGGPGVLKEPRNVYVKNQLFTNEKNLTYYFEEIIRENTTKTPPADERSGDKFGALKFATKLPFRPGASKTFILFPCTNCDPTDMSVEYSVLNQVLIEKGITLHILVDTPELHLRTRSYIEIYGVDSDRAYSKSDYNVLKGNLDFRREIKLTKSLLGYCTPLALETNGTIFANHKIKSEGINTLQIKIFSSVFARRIAATARADKCQTCECFVNANGIPNLECFPCSYPTPAYSDFDFKVNNTLSLFQAFDQIGDRDFKF